MNKKIMEIAAAVMLFFGTGLGASSSSGGASSNASTATTSEEETITNQLIASLKKLIELKIGEILVEKTTQGQRPDQRVADVKPSVLSTLRELGQQTRAGRFSVTNAGYINS